MKKIKEFIKENKVLIIGVGVAVVGGLVVYKLKKVNIAARVKHIEEGAEILRVLSTEPLFPSVESVIEVGTF